MESHWQRDQGRWGATNQGVKGDDADSVVKETDGQEARALFPRGYTPQSHTHDIRRHLLPLCVLVQLTRL